MLIVKLIMSAANTFSYLGEAFCASRSREKEISFQVLAANATSEDSCRSLIRDRDKRAVLFYTIAKGLEGCGKFRPSQPSAHELAMGCCSDRNFRTLPIAGGTNQIGRVINTYFSQLFIVLIVCIFFG
jgi:hypothetical protein